jgi:hypothetical protein
MKNRIKLPMLLGVSCIPSKGERREQSCSFSRLLRDPPCRAPRPKFSPETNARDYPLQSSETEVCIPQSLIIPCKAPVVEK